jgi:hypothetical protein
LPTTTSNPTPHPLLTKKSDKPHRILLEVTEIHKKSVKKVKDSDSCDNT